MRLLAAILCLLGPFDCASRAPAPAAEAPAAAVRFDTPRGTWVVRVEIARTDEERQRGLMFRRDLPKDTGMLFVFAEEDDHTFWMRNTYLSLDMIFIGGDRTVAGVVSNATPQSDAVRGIGKPSKYVLEVAAGEAAAHAVGPGVRAVLINVPE
jgi:uncharacterized membrane protein (UPF0127 family)